MTDVPRKAKNITGQTFNRLRAIEYVYTDEKKGSAVWKFLCDPDLGGCGKECIVKGQSARMGHTRSCGCLHRQTATKNGLAKRIHDDPPLVNRLYDYRNDKKWPLEVSDDEAIAMFRSDCVYCGRPPEETKNGRFTSFLNGIDRVDSSKGHVAGNCVPCCKRCNLSKRDYKKADFLEMAFSIAAHHGWRPPIKAKPVRKTHPKSKMKQLDMFEAA